MENRDDDDNTVRGADDLLPGPKEGPTKAELVAAECIDTFSDPKVQEETEKMMTRAVEFLAATHEKVRALPADLRSHYRGDLMAMARDMQRDLGLPELDEFQRSQMVSLFMLDDDDDDAEELPEPIVPPGEHAPA